MSKGVYKKFTIYKLLILIQTNKIDTYYDIGFHKL